MNDCQALLYYGSLKHIMGEYPHYSQGEVTSQIRIGARKETNLGRTVKSASAAVGFAESSFVFCLDVGRETFFHQLLRKRCTK